MAAEDLSTYTEVDPYNDLTVTSSRCAIETMGSNYDVYLRADKGVGHFGDFQHLVMAEFTSNNGTTWCLNGLWGLTDNAAVVSLADMDTAGEGLLVYHLKTTIFIQWVIKDFTNGSYDIWYGASFATPYYMTIERSGTIMTCMIYSDSGRTNLLDTLTITCGVQTYRYIFATQGHGSTYSGRFYSGYVDGLDLQEVVASEVPVANSFVPTLLCQKVVARSVYDDNAQVAHFIKDDSGSKIVH